MSQDVTYGDVVAANLELSAKSAATYNESEPHYLPENVARVRSKLDRVLDAAGSSRMLDLGCGTGFMIDIARDRVDRILGVDISPEMTRRVDTATGPAQVTIEVCDTATVELEQHTYDVVTAYSFFHHLFDVRPTIATAARALRPGGRIYVDLEPNRLFWDDIRQLDRSRSYDPIIEREIAMIADHQGVALDAGVDPDVFNLAEWGKTDGGGIAEDDMSTILSEAGFVHHEFFYEWFVGQGILINDPDRERIEAMADAEVVTGLLQRALPLSRRLFKYIGFVAEYAG